MKRGEKVPKRCEFPLLRGQVCGISLKLKKVQRVSPGWPEDRRRQRVSICNFVLRR